MDLENQKRVKEAAEKYGNENVAVLLGASEAEAAGLAAETVTVGRSRITSCSLPHSRRRSEITSRSSCL